MRPRRANGPRLAATLVLYLAAGCSAISGLGGLTFDSAGSGGAGAGGTNAGGANTGGAGECVHASDCSPRACIDVSCHDHRCVVAPSAAKTPCKTGVCDGHGSCVQCVNASDCLAPADCQVVSCVSRACVVTPGGAGTPCGPSGGRVCDSQGNCVGCNHDTDCTNGTCDPNHTCQDLCTDGVKNYDETDVDCGGSCPKCANGKLCAISSDCSSALCVDGVCCDSFCNGPCEACNLASNPGLCQPLPQDTEDPGICDATHGSCSGACACNKTGACKLADGALCGTQNSRCASGICDINSGKCTP